MRCIGVLVLPDGALLYIETGEKEHLLLERTDFIGRKLVHEELLGVGAVARIAPPVLYLRHPPLILRWCYAQGPAYISRVYARLFRHHHHDVIGRLVVDEQLAVAVHDGATGRKLHPLEKGIRVGILFEILAHELQEKQPCNIHKDDDGGNAANHILALLQLIVLLAGFLHTAFLLRVRKCSTAQSVRKLSTILLPHDMAAYCRLKQEKVSSAKKAAWWTATIRNR